MDRITDVPTLSDVMARHRQAAALTSRRRRDLVSGVRRMCGIIGLDPACTPASLQSLRPRINAVRPAKYNLTAKSWSTLRSNFRAAIVQGTPRQPRRGDTEWSGLRAALLGKRMRAGLSRLIGFCEDEAIAPAAMSDAVSARFLTHLEADTLVSSPRDCHRRSCRLWNEAAETIPGWPQICLKLPDYRALRSNLPISRFPVSLQEELKRYLDSLRGGDLFADEVVEKPLAVSTVRQRAVELGLALAALVASGRDPDSITSLACLVEPGPFTTILRHYLKDGKPRPFVHNIAQNLITLARRWVRPDAAALDKLRDLQRRLGPQRKGFTQKNRTLLRTLDDADVRAKLLLLPERLANWAERTTPVRGAVAMRTAVAIAILESAPLRIANLAGLRLDRHLVRPGGPRSLWQIDIPSHEVKNDQPVIHELPRRATTLVDRYLRRFRPSLAAAGNRYLFPVGSGHNDQAALSQQIRAAIADWVGIDMTPHQFRHFAGRVMQQHSPGAFAAIAQLLGHKDVRTTIAYYAEHDTLSAGRQFDVFVEAELSKARSRGRRS
jgi:integrase